MYSYMHISRGPRTWFRIRPRHGYFKDGMIGSAISQCKALSKVALSRGDALFHFGADASQMFFLVTGGLFYRREKCVKDVRLDAGRSGS